MAGRRDLESECDHDEYDVRVLWGLAGRLGLATEEAADGDEGAHWAAAMPPSAAHLDVLMPGVRGAEVLRRPPADPPTSRPPVVVATSQEGDPWERRELEQLRGMVLAKSNLSAPSAAERLADALHRAGSAAQAVGRAGTG